MENHQLALSSILPLTFLRNRWVPLIEAQLQGICNQLRALLETRFQCRLPNAVFGACLHFYNWVSLIQNGTVSACMQLMDQPGSSANNRAHFHPACKCTDPEQLLFTYRLDFLHVVCVCSRTCGLKVSGGDHFYCECVIIVVGSSGAIS